VKNITNNGLDKNKIILAYPLYGYEWRTYTQDFGSQIKRGWYQMISWKRAKEMVDGQTQGSAPTLAVKWDDLSMTPWLVFEEEGKIHQIYYENEKSLGIKIKLAEDNQFKGVGFWALGYEGEDNILLVDD
jgi:spore germination protein